MTDVHYVSPSTLPSRTANSVHVVWQCDGLAEIGAEVTLYARRSVRDASALPAALAKAYGVNAGRLRLRSYYRNTSVADSLQIAALAVGRIPRRERGSVTISRNLYAAFWLSVAERRPLIFETHQLEIGTRRRLQRAIMTRPHVITVVISHALLNHLEQHHGIAPSRPLVLPDAAPDGILPMPEQARRNALGTLTDATSGTWDLVCGYFGHLYSGRGVEMIEQLAQNRPRMLFLLAGGNDEQIAERRARNPLPNLRYLGHLSHPEARRAMAAVDVLLMPYQPSVSIGVAGHDTAGWMSPMKMFEYLASGVPIVASDLPALKEILHDGTNALLVEATDTGAWASAIDRLALDRNLARAIGRHAHEDYRNQYTWSQRARRLLDAAQSL